MAISKKIQASVIVLLILFAGAFLTMDVNAANVKLNQTKVTLETGASTKLQVKGSKEKVSWSSSKKKVADVSNNGKVTAKKEGKAVIRAKVADKTLKCTVTVTPEKLTKYWASDSTAANRLRKYVKKVTNTKSKDFIPEKRRIAVFDMDGTLTCETFFTYYDTMMFIDYCLKDYPNKVSDELKKEAASIRPGYSAGEDLARNFAKAYAGMTIKELYDYAVKFGKRETSSFYNMRYIDGFYLPMVELVKYLYENDFKIYVVSGTERTTTRAIIANSPIKDYVTPNQIIGTEFEVKEKGHEDESSNMDYKYKDGDELVYTGGFVQKNLNANKTIYIEREIGQMPVLAFGNSGSDTSMMNYALDKRNEYPAEAFMIVADDNTREWGTQDWSKKSKENTENGYTSISMKNDFKKIYPEIIRKAPRQYYDVAPERYDNNMTLKGKSATVKYKSLKKKNQTLSVKKAFTLKNTKGKLSYEIVKVSKKKNASKFKINKKTGKITVKKMTAKGTYKLKVKVTDFGTDTYRAKIKTTTVKVGIK